MMEKETSGPNSKGQMPLPLIDKFSDLLGYLAGAAFIVLAVVISVAIILRYALGISVAALTELTEYALYISVMLACPYVLKVDGHVNVDLLMNASSTKVKKWLKVICNLLGIVTSFVYLYYGAISTYETFIKKIPVIKTMAFPKWILLAVIPLVSALFIYYFAVKMWQLFRDPAKDEMEQNVSQSA